MWASWVKKGRRTEKEECESIDRDYLKMKISLECTTALATKQRTEIRSKGRERDGQASVEYELPGANKATKQAILRYYADCKLANQKARQKDKRVGGEDGGGRRETSTGNNSDDGDGTSTTAHLRFNHFSHSAMSHISNPHGPAEKHALLASFTSNGHLCKGNMLRQTWNLQRQSKTLATRSQIVASRSARRGFNLVTISSKRPGHSSSGIWPQN